MLQAGARCFVPVTAREVITAAGKRQSSSPAKTPAIVCQKDRSLDPM